MTTPEVGPVITTQSTLATRGGHLKKADSHLTALSIAAVVIGVVVLVAIIVMTLKFTRRQQQRRQSDANRRPSRAEIQQYDKLPLNGE